MVQAATDASETADTVCGEQGRLVCRWVFDRTGSRLWADVSDWLVDRPLSILVIVVTGVVVGRLLRRSVHRFGERAISRAQADAERNRQPGEPPKIDHTRTAQRASTLTSVLSSLVTLAVWVTVGLLVLGEVGISLAPLLAGAGVLGVVLAFGAQHIVADFLAGWFLLTEDQFGVGDTIDLGELAGTPVAGQVEEVSLRVTTLRDVHGRVWHVPNSEIRRVANESQLWSRAVLDIEVAYSTDIRKAEGIIQQVADDLWRDKTFVAGVIIEKPQVMGVERIDRDGVAIRLGVKTGPADQWAVSRELRLRLKEALDEANISIPMAQRTVWVHPVTSNDDRDDGSPGGTVPPSIG